MRLGENSDMATFIGTIEMLNSQIEELGPKPFSKDMVISKMLSNLPAAYDTFQTTWNIVASYQHTVINLHVCGYLMENDRFVATLLHSTPEVFKF